MREIELKHGKLYDCSVEINGIIEQISIIPLAKDLKSKNQFIMIDARKLHRENPQFVKEIIDMTYDYIMNDGIRSDYPSDYSALTIICTQDADGRLVDNEDNHIFRFVETNIL